MGMDELLLVLQYGEDEDEGSSSTHRRGETYGAVSTNEKTDDCHLLSLSIILRVV